VQHVSGVGMTHGYKPKHAKSTLHAF